MDGWMAGWMDGVVLINGIMVGWSGGPPKRISRVIPGVWGLVCIACFLRLFFERRFFRFFAIFDGFWEGFGRQNRGQNRDFLCFFRYFFRMRFGIDFGSFFSCFFKSRPSKFMRPRSVLLTLTLFRFF